MTSYATTRATRRPGGRDRVVVGGVDVTAFRCLPCNGEIGVHLHTKIDYYQLIEPFAYGPAGLSFPQIHGAYESAGTGDLSWMVRNATVLIQRVFDEGTEDETVVTDWRGFLLNPKREGRDWSWDCAGQLVGRAGLADKQPLVADTFYDVGRYVWQALAALRIPMTPTYGPVTGIEVAEQGNMTLLAWLELLMTLSMNSDGVQKTLVPSEHGDGGNWVLVDKDLETVHVTVFHDDERVKMSVESPAESAPNRIFCRGTTPAGEVVRNVLIPTLMAGQDPGYPISGGGSFGVGTSDADTVSGSGVTALQRALVQRWLLSGNVVETGTYTSAMAAAVRAVQRKAGLSQTGVVNSATWDALYDNNVVGVTPSGTKIHPMASDPRVEPWLYTTSGAYYARNPGYDPSVLPVDLTIEDLDGLTKQQMIAHAQGVLARSMSREQHWVGTIGLNNATGFVGDWDASDWEYLQQHPELIMPIRDIRAGMNVKAVLFEGGTVFHIGGIQVQGSGSASLTVDTMGRDYSALGAVLRRDREARQHAASQRFSVNRRTKKAGERITYDEVCGRTFRRYDLTGGQWTKVPLWMGRGGTVNVTDIRLSQAMEFAWAFVSINYDEDRWNRFVGNPMPLVNPGPVSIFERGTLARQVEDGVIAIAEGSERQPCGYGAELKYGDDGERTDAPLTGRFFSRASWTYDMPDENPLGALMIWVPEDNSLAPQRVFKAQTEEA